MTVFTQNNYVLERQTEKRKSGEGKTSRMDRVDGHTERSRAEDGKTAPDWRPIERDMTLAKMHSINLDERGAPR